MSDMNVLLVQPESYPKSVTIGSDLESLQAAVGGSIEVVYACLIIHIVHEQQTAVDLLVATVEFTVGGKPFGAFVRLEHLEPDGVGISALRHGEVFTRQFVIASFVPRIRELVGLYHLIRANLVVIKGLHQPLGSGVGFGLVFIPCITA